MLSSIVCYWSLLFWTVSQSAIDQKHCYDLIISKMPDSIAHRSRHKLATFYCNKCKEASIKIASHAVFYDECLASIDLCRRVNTYFDHTAQRCKCDESWSGPRCDTKQSTAALQNQESPKPSTPKQQECSQDVASLCDSNNNSNNNATLLPNTNCTVHNGCKKAASGGFDREKFRQLIWGLIQVGLFALCTALFCIVCCAWMIRIERKAEQNQLYEAQDYVQPRGFRGLLPGAFIGARLMLPAHYTGGRMSPSPQPQDRNGRMTVARNNNNHNNIDYNSATANCDGARTLMV